MTKQTKTYPRLTQGTVGRAKPGRYPDGGTRGQLTSFGLKPMVSPRGHHRFVQQLWFAGKPQDLPIGEALFVSLKEARAKMKRHRADTVSFTEVKAGLPKNGHKMEGQLIQAVVFIVVLLTQFG